MKKFTLKFKTIVLIIIALGFWKFAIDEWLTQPLLSTLIATTTTGLVMIPNWFGNFNLKSSKKTKKH